MACATALVNISESWRRAGGLANGCKDGPSVGIRGRQPSFCGMSVGLGCSLAVRSLISRGA
jgi:hypothetical protein